MAHAFTRVTLIGTRRHLDLLLPSDRPVGGLMPQVLDLLQDEPSEDVAAKLLVRPDGAPLDAAGTQRLRERAEFEAKLGELGLPGFGSHLPAP